MDTKPDLKPARALVVTLSHASRVVGLTPTLDKYSGNELVFVEYLGVTICVKYICECVFVDAGIKSNN